MKQNIFIHFILRDLVFLLVLYFSILHSNKLCTKPKCIVFIFYPTKFSCTLSRKYSDLPHKIQDYSAATCSFAFAWNFKILKSFMKKCVENVDTLSNKQIKIL